ncbi:uncharacterized protein LOC128996267 isoform X3 [Macrosteles quadrilineatus]|uniref:uncharacterized protein LOC128996267 isoform X3 n=1 Tax=Macrosteles quadrilineatus TaxID=74068 RepID=UPI0023E311F5|nr:uncharacterized protein LOC128996267 isoform X3 [Macrosteles quadrilineatus]
MDTEWSRQKKMKLIELYRQSPILWAKKGTKVHPKQRSSALQKIADEIGVNVLEVEKKLHVLRSQFMRERKKVLNSQNNEPYHYESHWQYYKKLAFLAETVDPPMAKGGKTNSTFNNTNNSSEGENSNLSASRGDADLNEDASFGYTSTVCIPYSHGGWEKKQPLPHSSTLANISSESFVREDQYLSNVSGTSSATQDDTENHDEESNIDEDERGGENEDALVSFGNYLVSLLRRLPLDKSYQLQQQFISDTINATIQMDKERCLMSQKKKKKADLNKQLHRPSAHEDRRKRSTAKGLLKNSGHRVQNLQPNKMLSAGRSEISERQRESSPDVSIKGEPITSLQGEPITSLVKIEMDNDFETVYCNGQPTYDSTGIADSP